jgi:hypothetical protein
LENSLQGLPPGGGVQVAGHGVGNQQVCSRFVGVAQVKAVLVQPAPDLGPLAGLALWPWPGCGFQSDGETQRKAERPRGRQGRRRHGGRVPAALRACLMKTATSELE